MEKAGSRGIPRYFATRPCAGMTRGALSHEPEALFPRISDPDL
jgi:hypothetical protein